MREKGNHWLVSVFVAALVTAASGLPVAAATFTLGSADGSFESGLGGTTTTGDVSLVPNLGVLQATQGTQALLMTTSPDAGATPGDADVSTLLIQNFTIGAQYGTLRLSYNFLTNEPGPSFTNDQFLVKLVLVSAGGEQTLLSSDTFDNFLPAPFTGYNTQTGFRSLSADISAFAGSGDQYTLELRIEDIGDGRRDSAVLIDNLRLVEPGYPTAVANLDYLEINPGDNILLDGRASSDDGSIVEYRWDFGNNSFSTGAFFTILSPYPDAGFYQGSLTVTDNDGNTDTDHFTVAVGGLNRPPVIVSQPVIGAAELVAYRYQVQVEDPELAFGDKMSYALTTAPTGMTIDPDTGVIRWTPPAGAARRHDVTLQVTDSGGLSDSQSYTIAIGPEVYVATLGDDSRFYTARSNGDGTFSGLRLEEDMSTSGATRGVVIADFTGDNNFDLITGYPEDSRLQLFLYERYAGRMQTPVYLGAFDTANPSYLMDMAAEDFDNDADIDFVVDTNTERAWYFENTGPLVTQPEDFYFGGFESDNDGWGGQTCSTTFQRTDTDAFTGSWSLRVAATNNSSCMSIDVNPSNWFMARGSSAGFAYRIPAGTPVGLLFNVSGFGWIYLGGSPAADGGIYDFPDTPKVSLIDDGQWHTIAFNLRDAIQAHWPGASQVTEFEWYTNSNASNGQEFWFDDFRITRPRMVSGFSAKLLPNTGSAGRGMDAGDANNDGNMDFVRANSGGQLFLYTGDGAGNFTTSQIGTTSDPYGLVMADFDNDGKADVIAINGGSGDPYFYAGNGNGTFQAGVYVPSMDVNNHASYGVFDFNGDGNQDVVVSTYSSQQFWYYPGNGDGSFGERTLIGTTSGSNILSAAAPAGRSIGQPFALATSDATLITEGGTINFDGSDSYDDGTIVSYAWDFGDGTTASGVTTSHDFINEGRYVVILTVTDDSGLKSTFAIHVTVNGELPVADPGGPYTLGEAQSLLGKWHGTLDGTGSSDADTSIARYEWDFDASDGIGVDSTDRYPRPTYSAVGSYTVTLTVYDEVNQSSTATTTVNVTQDAIPVPAINGPATLNENDASLGRWTGWYETSASSDDHGIASYHVAWGDGTTFDLAPLADDFSDGNYTANPVWSVNGGTWSVTDGILQQSALGTSWRWLQDRSRRYRDFQLEVDVKGISGSTDGYIGIVFRNANGAGSQDTFLLYSQNSWDFWRFYDWSAPSGSNVIAEGGTGWDPEIWYHLRLVMVGDTMQLFVTPEGGVETLQLETTNAAHPRGGIGLLAYDQVLLYDNVKVIPLDSDWDVDGTMLDGVAHTFNATGNYPITLTVVDHAGQSVDALLDTPVEAGAPPVADAGGPYTLDEHDAFGGLWNLIVNAGGSSDDTHVERLQVDFGDGTSYTTGFANGVRGSYFASGTDLYGYDTAGADLRRVVATEDGTRVEIINLANGTVIDSTTLNRMQAWDPSGSPPGDGIFFKVKADKPVVAYFTDLGGHSTFVPSLDGDPVGKEFIFYLDINSGFYVYAYEDAVVSFYASNGSLAAQRSLRAGDYWDSPAGAADYRVVSSGRISMQTTAANGYTTVPSENGDGAGQLFLFATYTGTTGSIAVFAHEAADIEVFDLDSGASLYTATVAAGQMWYQNSVGTRRLRLESTADVEVWAGDTEAGTTISNLGDDISFAGGRGGTEFVLHTLADGVVIFAPNDNTNIDVDGGALTATLQRDGYLLLAPTDFPGGAGVHRIVTSQPVVIQTLGRSNVFNDLGTYLGGVSMRHQYDTPGIYTLAVTAIDNAGQIHTDTTTVEVKVNDPPIAVIDAPAVADESFAIGGQWSVDFDASGSSDDVGIFSYQWDFGDGTTGSGVSLTHIYTVPGSYTVTLTVTDHAGQQTQTTFIVEVTLGAGPTADAGGPYVFGEEFASYGIWTATLDGSGSTDDSAIFDYVWEFDPLLTEDFADAAIDTAVWTADAGASIQSGRLVNPGSGWGPTGHYSVQSIKRIAGTVRITGEIQTPSSGNAMWGLFTAAPSNFSYTNMPHAIYFSSGTLYVYENGSQRGNVGSYTRGETYEARIDLYESGASYYIRLAGAAEWTPLTAFTPTNPSNSPLRMGASVNSGSFAFDNYRIVELLEGPIVTREYSEVGTHNVTLTVRDNALQVDTDTTTITIADGAPPVAEAGGDYTAEVGSFVQFNGTGSTDDVAIQTYHWLFGDTTGGAADLPFTGKGPAPRHFYQQVGSYTAELTVTDNTLKSDSDTATVNVIVGAPPVASGQAISQGAAGGPPVYFNAENSSDDFGIVEYRWDFDAELDRDGDGDPTNDIDAVGARPFHTYPAATTPDTTHFSDDFNDGAINGWTTNGTVEESGGTLQVTGNNWGSGYIFTNQTFDRAALRLTALVHTSATSGNHMMFGVKNNNTASGHYNQLLHAIYFNNGSLNIYEEGSSRGGVGSYTPGGSYEVRIDIKSAGADYFIRQQGAAAWTALTNYSSLGRSSTPVRIGADAHSGVWGFDDVQLTGTGPKLVTLTVEDGAGQTSSMQLPVDIAPNLPPDVIAVPWVAHDLLVPHEIYNGKTVHLKGIVRDADAQTFQWDFGDGTQSAVTSITNKYDLSVTHTYPAAPNGTPFTAKLRVWDSLNQMGEDSYIIVVKPKTLSTETNVAIDEGLWYLHQQQTRTTAEGYDIGYWTSDARASATASSIQSFLINSHLETVDPAEDPYQETVMRGLRQLFRDLGTVAIATQTYGEPDTNGNDLGIQTGVNSSGSQPIYQGGQVMDAIASTGTPLARTITGSSGINRRSYFDILTDMADQFSWGQTEEGNGGAWRYNWNSSIDNSAAQWGAIGLLAAEDIFGIPVSQWVKDRNQVWLNNSYSGTGWGYTSGISIAGTPSGLVQMVLDDQTTRDPRWLTAEKWIADNWNSEYLASPTNRHYYALYATTKAMRLAQPEPVVNFSSNGFDWFSDPVNGLARTLIDDQQSDGRFPGSEWITNQLRSAWGVIMLSRTLFVQPPVADAGRDRVWAVDLPLEFDGSNSFHLDPFRSLVKYEWDFDGDGVYDSSSTQPTATYTYPLSEYPEATLPQTISVTLRVTDNNIPPLQDTDTVAITIAIPPHPPVAEAGGPYTCTQGVPCELDGSGSFDIDPTDFITSYEWELDGLFPFDFDEANGAQPAVVFDTLGTHNVGLRVWDNAVLNDVNGNFIQDPEERLSDQHFTTVNVVVNLPPVAAVNGPFTIDEGASITLDATGSSDPNGDLLQYTWDLDNDGLFDDATGATYLFTGLDDGVYPVQLQVSDTLLTDTTATSVTVNNVAPSVDAGPDQTIDEGGPANFSGSFSDPGILDTHTIVWDFGDGSGDSGDLNTSHTYTDDGVFTVTLTVTDDDGGVGSDTLVVTVNNVPPVVDAGPDATLNEGETFVSAGSFTDQGADSWTATVDYGEGAGPEPLALNPDGSFALSNLYEDDGVYTVTVTVTDDEGASGVDTATVTVNNVAPAVDAGPDATLNEGETFVSGGSFTDPGADSWTATVDYGEGAGPQPLALNPDGSFALSNLYEDDGVYTVTVTVTDDEGASGVDTATVTVNNLAPVVDAGTDQSGVPLGTPISLDPASFTDAGLLDTHIATIDWGDGTVESGSVNQGSGNGTVSGSHLYASAGNYTVTVTVTDNGGLSGNDSFIVGVEDTANTRPNVDAGPDATIDEGSSFTSSGSFTDPDPDSWTATVDYGEGAGPQPLALNPDGSFVLNNLYEDDGVFTVTVRVTDDKGATGADTVTVTVNNVAPLVDAGPDATLNEGETFVSGGSFTDPGADSWTATVDYGEGAGPEPLALNPDGSFALNNPYQDNGVYTVTVTVTDDEGASGSDTVTVTVNDLGPTAVLTGDTLLDEGQSGSYNAAGSTSSPDAIVSYEWDLDNDGLFDDATGPSASYTWMDNGSYPVLVRVTDDDGSVDVASLTVTVNDLGPTAILTGDTTLNEGQNGNYSAAGSTSSPDAIVLYEWDLDNDGLYDDATGAAVSYSWPSAGNYPVSVRVTDEDGSTDTATLLVTVQSAAAQTIFDLSARPKPNEVFLTWAPVAGADSYNVYRSTTQGGPYSLIAANHVCDYCAYYDNGLTNDVTYYYVVTSVTGGAESLHSNEASAKPTARTTRSR